MNRTLPQRQLHFPPLSQDLKRVLLSIPETLASSPAETPLVYSAPSITEGRQGPAIFVYNEIRADANVKNIHREVAHVHPSDLSLHVYLSGKDARLVVQRGWGMRFPVSWLAPMGWVMVFAPRDEAEVEVVKRIVRAGIAYALGHKPDGSQKDA